MRRMTSGIRMIVVMAGVIFSAGVQTAGAVELEQCLDKDAGVSFSCSPDWKTKTEGKKLIVTIRSKPLVEMTIEETPQKLRFLSELSMPGLETLGGYAPNFTVNRMVYCDRETIRVDGQLKGDSNARVRDFYFQDHLQVHTVRFLVDPQEAWEDYQVLIEQLADTIGFVRPGKDRGIKLVTKDTGTCEDLME